MSDKIYVKHSLGSFQQPYLHQVATNNQTTSTGTTQGTTRGNTQQPSQYQNQGTSIVQQPVNAQTARQGSTQQPLSYIYQSPSIGIFTEITARARAPARRPLWGRREARTVTRPP